jgi:hypothetical protein
VNGRFSFRSVRTAHPSDHTDPKQEKTVHTQAFAGGKPDTPACTTCHGKDPRAAGRTPAGKNIATQ